MTTKEKVIKYLDFKNISKRDFYRQTGLSNGFLDSGKHIGSDNIKIIVDNYRDLNLEWLVMDEGEMIKPNVQNLSHNESRTKSRTFLQDSKNAKNVLLNEERQENKFHTPKVVTIDKQGRDNVVLVPNKAAAGYLTGYGDTTFIKSLPTYNLPNISNGTFRMFQVAGDSMEPTIQNQSYVVGEWKENWNEDIKDGRVYIFVIQSFEYEGILVKRALNRIDKYGNVLLKSDNRIYGTKTFTPEEIKEVWEVKLYLSFNIPDPATIYDRMNDLEARLIELEQPKKRKN